MPQISSYEQERQEQYRDARFTNKYDTIWQSVNKCVFCDLNEKYVLFEENGIVMTISLYAYIDGHLMIVPRRHVTSTKELSQLEWDTVRRFMYIAKKLVKEVQHINGMQFIQKDGVDAQSTVEHLHFHAIPFDAPDLCQWNYRKLKNTPLENVAIYKNARKKIVRHNARFQQKYQKYTTLPVVCDLIAINNNNEVLLQKRKADVKLSPDNLTLLGGHVIDFSVPLEQELAREVYEESGWQINTADLHLLKSEIGNINHAKISKHLNARYIEPSTFVWNTYVLLNVDPGIKLSPGDDSESLIWIPIAEAATHPRLTDGVKSAIQLASSKYNINKPSKR